MPDGSNYDYRTDPDFQKASLQDKVAYLMHADADFASASPQDK